MSNPTPTPCKSQYFTYASAIPTLAFTKSCASCEPANSTHPPYVSVFPVNPAHPAISCISVSYKLKREKTPRTQAAPSSPQGFILLAPYIFSPLQPRFPNPEGCASPVKILTASTASRQLRSILSP